MKKSEKNWQKAATELGWLQLSILTMLWTKEMYGLEIKEHLELKGYVVATSQLYPALATLEKYRALNSREEESVGRLRKFYTITQEGRELIFEYANNLMLLFSDLVEDGLAFLADKIPALIEFVPGTIVADLSQLHIEKVISRIGALISPTGRWIIPSADQKSKKIWLHRMEHIGLQDIATIVDLKDKNVLLPEHIADVVLLLFTLHEDVSEWTIKEMRRLLKPTGKGLIIDGSPLKEPNILLDMLLKFLPGHSNFGVNLLNIDQLLQENQLHIIRREEKEGVLYLIVGREA
ncbi:MAG: helix-turn-helix transcriptional regulator [Candidatus Thorarchaeota archaeon]